jgi:hypothetical protein
MGVRRRPRAASILPENDSFSHFSYPKTVARLSRTVSYLSHMARLLICLGHVSFLDPSFPSLLIAHAETLR